MTNTTTKCNSPTRHILTTFAAMLCTLLSVAAQSRIELPCREHNFGTIEEAGGDVHCTFVIRNISPTPIVITRVRTTCSCVTTRYNRKPIAQQSTDTLRVTFDPRFRAGAINRTISLHISGDPLPTTLSLSGHVTPRPH